MKCFNVYNLYKKKPKKGIPIQESFDSSTQWIQIQNSYRQFFYISVSITSAKISTEVFWIRLTLVISTFRNPANDTHDEFFKMSCPLSWIPKWMLFA